MEFPFLKADGGYCALVTALSTLGDFLNPASFEGHWIGMMERQQCRAYPW